MKRPVAQIQALIRELRRRQVIRVAVVYATTGFVILQLAEILVEPFGLGPRALRLITLVLILGFPLAVGLAWVYNLTDEGVVEVEDGSTQDLPTDKSTVTSNGLIVGLLVVAIGLLLYPRVFPSGEKATGRGPAGANTSQVEERSIAVLPFEALSSGEEPKTFARGTHDDLLTRLANISDLTVISRTAVERYRDTDLTTGQIADSLGVRWILEGGVQVLGDQIQVNAQLIDPRSEAHVWADDYQRSLSAENLFAIQGEITREIADALQAKLTAGEQSRVTGAPTGELKAYRLYVKGRGVLDRRTEAGMRTAIDYFQQALKHDSIYAPAWAALAEARGNLGGYGHVPMDSVLPKASRAARRALQLDPDLAEAHASAGLLHLYRFEGPAALRELRKALRLKPSLAQAHRFLGLALDEFGQPGGLAHLRRSVELNPMTPESHADLGVALLVRGQYAEALRRARRTRAIEPDYRFAHHLEVMALYHLGRLEEALSAHRREDPWTHQPTWHRATRALLYVAEGDSAAARKLLAELQETGAYVAAGWIHAAFGDANAAFQAFEQVRTWTHGQILYLRYGFPKPLRLLRGDRRYRALIRELNRYCGLNPDGTIPEPPDSSVALTPEADA